MTKQQPNQTGSPTSQFVVCIGIDWADQTHAYHLNDLTEEPMAGTVEQQPGQIKELVEIWRQQYPDSTFCVALQQSKGPFINILLEFSDIQIYPVNPAGLAGQNHCRNPVRTKDSDFSCRVNLCSGSRLCYRSGLILAIVTNFKFQTSVRHNKDNAFFGQNSSHQIVGG